MSKENVVIVRRGYEAFIREGPEGIYDFLHPGIASGAPIEIHDAHLWTHDEAGLVTTFRMFIKRDRAFEAADITRTPR